MTDSNNNFRAETFTSASQTIGVSTLNRFAREALEALLPLLWVGGEISNLSRATSGHIYFTLKDAQAQVRCAMWRNRAQLLPFRPENGMRVEARALVTLYEARGDYQLNVEALRPAGAGDLHEAFRRLKDKLAAEGLFDPARRRPLPIFPRTVGIVTSPAAAVLHDVLATLRRRAPGLPAVLYPAAVQGADAPRQLCEALKTVAQRAEADGIDLILLVRGGGSLEDLQAFNDETLARTITACPLPVVSGVGHETDFTIADFAADLRAPTPTAAAELVSAGYFDARNTLSESARRLHQAIDRQLAVLAQRLDRCALRLVHPRDRLRQAHEALFRHEYQIRQAMTAQLSESARSLSRLELRLHSQRPAPAAMRARLDGIGERLERAAHALLAARRQTLGALTASLRHLGPHAVLARGYAIVRNAAGDILRSAADARPGNALEIQLTDGRIDATVDAKHGGSQTPDSCYNAHPSGR
ncbi:MAG: exodeoxyribonuclease VII large subunit [Azoarcus sp.]|jgi:exodeoxyribonuclease VII large subunit|nr:exodeoxyribonuclease VII large subunit [Azoarcus sp.]